MSLCSSLYSMQELRTLGISLPQNPTNIKISKKVSLYNPHLMHFNNHIRIDDFCILSGKISIGSFVHIGAFCALYGGVTKDSKVDSKSQDDNLQNDNLQDSSHAKALYLSDLNTGIIIKDFCTISPKATIFATNDDFSGDFLISPMVESTFCGTIQAKVILHKHTQICANAIILPNVICAEGSVLGAMSVLKTSTDSFSIYAGNPAKKIKDRSKNLLELEKAFLAKFSHMGGGE